MSSLAKERDPLEEQYMVDSDFHLQIDHELFLEYVEDSFLREKLEEEGVPPFPSGGGNPTYQMEMTKSLATTQGVAVTREEIKRVKEDWHLDTVIGSPLPNTNMANGRYPVMKKALIKAYHEYLKERVVDPDNDIYALAVANDFDPEWTAEELDRVLSHDGFVGATNWLNYDEPMGLHEVDPIFETLTDYNMPLVYHQGVSGDRYDEYDQHYSGSLEGLVAGMYRQLTANVMSMVMNGVFDKYPGLNVVIQEQGTAWIPYVANLSDQLYSKYSGDVAISPRMYEEGWRELKRQPSEYIYDNFYVTTQPIALPERGNEVEAALKSRRAEDMFVFSTDWPHSTVDTPDWINHPKIDSDLRKRISHKNAEEAYGRKFAT